MQVVSHATRPFGSCARIASSTASEILSQILSGCPSVTDSDVKRCLALCILLCLYYTNKKHRRRCEPRCFLSPYLSAKMLWDLAPCLVQVAGLHRACPSVTLYKEIFCSCRKIFYTVLRCLSTETFCIRGLLFSDVKRIQKGNRLFYDEFLSIAIIQIFIAFGLKRLTQYR